MAKAHFIHDPQHWLQRAAEMRKLAGDIRDPDASAALSRIADDYERLAERADIRAAGTPKPS